MINDLSVYKFLAMKYFPFGIFGICVFFYCISASSVHVEHLVPLWYLTLYKRFLFLWKLLESLESWYSELFWYLVSPFNLDAHTFQLQEISWYYSSGITFHMLFCSFFQMPILLNWTSDFSNSSPCISLSF